MKQTLIILSVFIGITLAAPRLNVISHLNSEELSNGNVGIYKGTPTNLTKHPWIVSLWFRDNYCSGTILSESWVLTTADCVGSYSAAETTVFAESPDTLTGIMYKANLIVLHPKYAKKNHDYDYALINIRGIFTWSHQCEPVRLPTHAPSDNLNMTIVGYGTEKVLKKGVMTWLPKTDCEEAYKNVVDWNDRLACAYSYGGATPCKGDYGDPIVRNGFLYGQFVAGLPEGFCSKNAKPILLSNVVAVLDWIHAYISD